MTVSLAMPTLRAESLPPVAHVAGASVKDFGFDSPNRFFAHLPEGNYLVRVTLGDKTQDSDTTVKAEARRLMLESVKTAAGQTVTREFVVNIRQASIAGGDRVKLNDRELGGPSWDDKLTLEFVGPKVHVVSVDVEPAKDVTTVYIAGDSTVCDQGNEPWAAWGQVLPRFFKPTVAVANYAESGRALYSFRSEKRLDKILSVIKGGDYLFIQFGHNDQKDKSPGAGAFTSYKRKLEEYVAATRAKGATPVLVTPMYRRRFDGGKLQESLGDYPAAVRKVAEEQKVALIDLHEMSGKLFGAMGEEGTKKAFVFFPANSFPGQKEELKDNTHFNAYGAYELARCVVEGLRTSGLPLAKQLADDVTPFDPSRPDAPESVKIPASLPPPSVTKPEGN
jgi:lysophospholipase L1-like esterase